MSLDRYTPTYRAVEAQQVMDWVKAGQSGYIVGLFRAGRHNFQHFLMREDVRRRYLGQDYIDFTFVLVNLLALTEPTHWAVYELILDRLLSQVHPPQIEEKVAEEMASLHREVMRTRDTFNAQRTVERCVGALCRRPDQRVVLIFEEFDAVFHTLDPSLFRCLRAIREAHKDQILYIVVVAEDLIRLRDDLVEVELFCQLVRRNVCYLGPYNEADAQQMIRYLASRRAIELSAEDTALLIELSGGHAGLIETALSLLWDAHREDDLADLATTLSEEPVVRAECRKVWDSLLESEQAALCALASGTQVGPRVLHRLKRRGLIWEGQSSLSLFSPVFADFVRHQAPPSVKGTAISRSPRIVQIDGRRIEDLTEMEFELLCYLYEHRGQVCAKDDLIANTYRRQYDKMEGGVTDEALQTLISRLRAKIEPDRERPLYIVTIRGEGYEFVEKHNNE